MAKSKETTIEEIPNNQRFLKLERDIEEEKKFYNTGLERIREYYSLPEDKRGEKTGLKNSPHEILAKRASDLISIGLESIEKSRYLIDESTGHILIGVGTEILLKAIILKEDSNYFVENIRGEKTLSFQQCVEKLTKLFQKILTPKQVRRIKEVLKLIQQRRNNLIHLGFHQMESSRQDYQIAHLLEFLFLYFLGENANPIVEKLREFKEKRKVISGMDYEPLKFLEGQKC